MEQQQFNLVKLLKALWRFKWIIALMVVVAVGTAWIFTSEQPPVYEAMATVMVESGQPRLTALPAGLESGLQFAYLQDIGSQIQVMKSRNVLERAVTQLEPEKAGNPEYLQLEANKLSDSLKVQQVGNTNLVEVTVASYDPIKAQKQANAVTEAYVYEAGKARLTAIETALDNTTEQLKKLNATEVDISVSPLLTPITVQIDTALAALGTATEHLDKVRATESSEEAIPAAKDAGTTLTPLQLDTIGKQVEAASDEAIELSTLAQQIKLQITKRAFVIKGADTAIIEVRTRALATKLAVLAEEVETMREVEIDPQVQSQLLAVEEQLRVASTTTGAILNPVSDLYSVRERLEEAYAAEPIPDQTVALYKAIGTNILYRMVEHTTLAATTLEAISGQLQQIQPRKDTLKQWELRSLMETLRERLRGGVASATSVLDEVSKKLRPSAPEQDVLLTHGELATIQNNTKTVTTNLASLLSDVEKTQLDELDPPVHTELLHVREQIRIANDATKELPAQIAALDQGGGDSLSSEALDNLRQQLQLQLLTSSSGGPRVMGTAVVSSPSTTLFGRLKSVILAAVAALLLGALVALVLQYFDRRVRDASQVSSYVGLPVLAHVAMIKGAGNPHPPTLLGESPSQYLESFRLLRTNLGLDSSRGKVILVSSPEGKEGKTTLAANLARAVALQGRRVLLIDGSLRKPEVAAAFGLAEVEGLSEFLTGENEPWDYITQAEGVDILPSGAASAKSTEMLSSPQMKALLENAREIYDVVIVDSAPVMGCADTRILAREVDEVLLVLQPNFSKLDLARDSRQVLETMGAQVAGFALNK